LLRVSWRLSIVIAGFDFLPPGMSRLKSAPPARSKNASFWPTLARDGEAFGLIARYLGFAGGPGLVTGMFFFFCASGASK
jgi:hypothetical protein